ncbi:MAG: sulfite exporter TauE/SafE family protein [Clostridia bacterium]
MTLLIKFIICIVAGLGAGFGTGISGLSAAAVIAPMLVTFLGTDPYEAVGIALASDVLASAASAYTYGKNKNIDIKNGIVMLISVLIFTLEGSYIASFLPETTMGGFSMFMTLFAGIKFIVKPVMTEKSYRAVQSKRKAVLQSILCGTAVGLICGFVGAGGGMLMLLVLVSVLGYELKTAVGTSVFIMTFTAFTGATSHFVIGGGISDYVSLILCILFTLIGAVITAKFANKMSPVKMNRLLGIGLSLMSIIMIIIKFF